MLNGKLVGHETGRLLDRLLSGCKPPKQSIRVPPGEIRVRQSFDVLVINDEDVVTATQFIRERFLLPITVHDVLKAVSVIRRTLELRFRRALGRGVAQEISRMRLEHCKRLLTETDFLIPLVAQHSGFSRSRQLAVPFNGLSNDLREAVARIENVRSNGGKVGS